MSEHYVAELQRCVVETNTPVVDSLDGLHDELGRHRRVLVETAAELGMGVVAAGAVVAVAPVTLSFAFGPLVPRAVRVAAAFAARSTFCALVNGSGSFRGATPKAVSTSG